ncbi:hypothetical protein H696_01447 [Fonticula alba]|uniref:Methyltransferase small domain-containing protein n=1 Tax=Fonticula alba TaxID=691883 RepID=A0A058ZCA6_FONAL|nr:hypothetical protein H696_01447 [Fonticula alba]KCV72040.1 hypothetical protein H696_01447 [Fonticula alba]|eukprot:XP_009493618.1 hypothetical protein H696_01447 [Fonticula alba]
MLEAERAISGRRREALAGSHAAGPDTSHALGPAVLGTGVDLSAGALAVARRNAFRLGLGHRCTFLQSDWLARLGAGPAGSPPSPGYDLLLCNPPYIPPGDIATGRVQASVWRHEPASALFPNPLPGRAAPVPEAPAENDAHDDDGLDAVRRIAAARPGRWLAPPRRALPPAATLADIHRAGAGVLLLEIGEGQAATARDILLAADPSLAPVPGVGMLAGAGAFGGGAAMVAAAGPGIVIDYGHIPRLVALYRRRP